MYLYSKLQSLKYLSSTKSRPVNGTPFVSLTRPSRKHHPLYIRQQGAAPVQAAARSEPQASQKKGLDALLASASTAPPATKPSATKDPLESLNLDDLLAPPSKPIQRSAPAGTSAPTGSRSADVGGWNEPSRSPQGRGAPRQSSYGSSPQSPYDSPPQSSYGSSFDQDFGSSRGQFSDPSAAHEKAVKGDRTLTTIEVSDDGACAVEDKDIDPKTVEMLKARGIVTFTPVQVRIELVALVDFWLVGHYLVQGVIIRAEKNYVLY